MSFDYSVAINAYNREAEIGETIESVLAQVYSPSEVVVIDDGSTDGTGEVVGCFGDRVDYMKIDNVGPGQSRHAAVSRCSSTWIATCDSDDIWEPEHIKSIAQTINVFPDTVLAFSNTTRFGPNETGDYNHFNTLPEAWWFEAIKETRGDKLTFGDHAYRSMLQYNPVYPSCSVFRRDVYHRIGGAYAPFSRTNSEDSDLTRRFSLAGRISCSTSVTVQIRKHGDNFSASIASNLLGKYFVLDRHVRELSLSTKDAADAAVARDEALLRAFRHAYWEGDVILAHECRKYIKAGQLTLVDWLRLLKLSIMRMFGKDS